MTSEELARRIEGQTVATRFRATVQRQPDAVALRWREGDGWCEWTWADYAARATRLTAALAGLGVSRGDRVVLMMRNRPEFHVADMAVLLLGATPISIYNSSAPEQVRYLVGHCRATVGVFEGLDYLGKVLEVRRDLPALAHVAVIDDPKGRAPSDVLRWDDLLAAPPVDLDSAADTAQPADLATVIYTSGTTGPPKGVMLDHANVCWTAESLRLALAEEMTPEGRRLVSYLPMAHIAERMTSHYQGVSFGYEVTTCPEPGQIASYLTEVRPEVLFAVPRVWEKIHAGVQAVLAGDAGRRVAFERALEVGGRAAECRARGEELPADLRPAFEQTEAETLRPVRELLGLDQVVAGISGAAPIPREVFDFFRALGVPLSEIYGLSETSGPMTWEPFRVRPGTVGPPIAGCEVRLADDGEVICRGGNVFRGYLEDPERTADAIDTDGWFHSGDVGVFDEAGFLTIVDRKKELIITAGGKNISPANLEAALKAHPLIGQACVIGDGRPFVAALLVLDPEVAPAWAKQHGLEAATLAALAESPEVRAELQHGVDNANAAFSQVERVKRFVILHDEWMPDSVELTPTMKLKRRGIHSKYAGEIESLYR